MPAGSGTDARLLAGTGTGTGTGMHWTSHIYYLPAGSPPYMISIGHENGGWVPVQNGQLLTCSSSRRRHTALHVEPRQPWRCQSARPRGSMIAYRRPHSWAPFPPSETVVASPGLGSPIRERE